MNSLKSMHDKIYKVVFLDIFDTIVYRTVQPEYTKKIWANRLVKYFKIENYSMLDVYNLRNKTEYNLGQDNNNKGNDWEFTYNQLLESMYQELHLELPKKKFIDISTELEIEIEASVLKLDEEMIQEIKKAKKDKKKIYCVSDMYLSKSMVQAIFKKLNILDLFDDIFISCEFLKNKKSGKLFDVALEKTKSKPEETIMIGDNQSSDYEIPKSRGINAIHLDRKKYYKIYEDYALTHDEKKVYEDFWQLTKTKTDNFEHAIFTLYQFTERLYYQLLNDGLDEVFFLSREGEYLKKLFDSFNEKVFGKKIKSHYILVSRKATYLPSLRKLEEEDFEVLLKQYLNSSISEFLGSLNFNHEERETVLKSFHKDCEKVDKSKLKKFDKEGLDAILSGDYNYKIVYLYGSELLKVLKKNKDFKNIYEKNRVEQRDLFHKYIKQNTSSKNICVVDIGWNGSIQDNIQNILGKDYNVTGYLYGLISRNPDKCKKKQGLIFTNVPDYSKNFILYGENRSIYEILLGASHGSANKYKEENGKVIVTTFEKEEEKQIYENVISHIQKDMFTIYEKLEDLFINGYYDNKKIAKKINKVHFDMLFSPSKEQLKFFNKIYHYENFGVFEFSKFNLKKDFTIKFYLKENAKYILKRKSFFNDAFWPTLKLHNEKLYIPQFTYKMYQKLRLIKKGVL